MFKRKKIVIIGAGKIGMSFIGLIFSQANYSIVFIDKDESIIKKINKHKKYKVLHKSDTVNEEICIANVSAVLINEKEEVIDEIVEADIAAVSVGKSAWFQIFPIIAEGILTRNRKRGLCPLDIILAENISRGEFIFKHGLLQFLPAFFPIDATVGIVETSIGKMVPIQINEDFKDQTLRIIAEPYNELIVGRSGFLGDVPDIRNLHPKDNIKAWIDKKLFIHNLGHVTIAYTAYLFDSNLKYVWEALEIDEIYNFTNQTMHQAAEILLTKYPNEFSKELLDSHINDLLLRFKNKALGDTLYRVGCDLNRKLSSEDRIVGAIRAGIEQRKDINNVLFVLVCGFFFDKKGENGFIYPGDLILVQNSVNDFLTVLLNTCKFDLNTDGGIVSMACDYQKKINESSFRSMLKELFFQKTLM